MAVIKQSRDELTPFSQADLLRLIPNPIELIVSDQFPLAAVYYMPRP